MRKSVVARLVGVAGLLAIAAGALSQGTVPVTWVRPGLGAWPNQLSQTQDGTILAVAANDAILRLWRTSDGTPIGTYNVDASRGVISGDGLTFLAARLNNLHLHRIIDGTNLRTFVGHTQAILDVKWSNDATLAASAADDNTARLWNVTAGTLLQTLPHPNTVFSVAISPNKQLVATGCRDWFVRIWRVSDGALLQTLEGQGPGYGLSFSPDGSLLVAGRENSFGLRIWETATWSVVRDVPAAENANTCAWYPNGQFVFFGRGGAFGAVGVTRIADGNTRTWITSADHATCPVAVSLDAQQLFVGAGDERRIHSYRESDGQLLSKLGDHIGPVLGVGFSSDNSLIATGSHDRTVQLFDSTNGSPLGVLGTHDDAINSVAFSPNGGMVASGSDDRSVKLWRLSDRTLLRSLIGHTSAVTSVAFSPTDAIVASGSADGTVRIWSATDGSLLRTLTTPVPTVRFQLRDVRAIAFSSDGSLLAAASRNGLVTLYRTSDFGIFRLLSAQGVGLFSVAFSPDGQYVAAGAADRTARVWPLSGGPQSILTGFGFPVRAVAFTTDSQFLMVGERSNDGAIRSLLKVYRVSDLSLVNSYNLETGSGINGIAIAPNGQSFAIARHDSTVLLGPAPH